MQTKNIFILLFSAMALTARLQKDP